MLDSPYRAPAHDGAWSLTFTDTPLHNKTHTVTPLHFFLTLILYTLISEHQKHTALTVYIINTRQSSF